VPMGLKVGKKQMRDLIGLGEPDEDDELLTAAVFHPRAQQGPASAEQSEKLKGGTDDDSPSPPSSKAVSPTEGGDSEPGGDKDNRREALNAQLPVPKLPPKLPLDAIAESAGIEAGPAIADMLARIKAIVAGAGSLEEMKAMLEAAGPELSAADLADAFSQALLLAELTGRAEIQGPASGLPLKRGTDNWPASAERSAKL
jgi:phage gp29-like protein